MPPKPSAKKTKSNLENDEQVQYPLQAVLVCDVDSNRFEPLNNEIHPILFPLGGTPILAYTLEFLERGGVEEVFLISSYPSQITTYLESSRWGERGYPVKTSVISAPRARSVGDFLREVDRRGLVKSDFVLVRGGVLSNLALPSIVEEHRKMKELDKDVMLMTMVLMQSEGVFSSRRNLRDARLHVLDEANTSVSSEYEFHRCLLSERVEVHPERKRYVHLSKEIISRHPNVLFRNDLYDCNVEICTPEVPALFTENFDYEDLRRDFVNGVLTSDLLTKNIYCYIPNNGYGGNITSFEEYWRVSNDMAKGMTAPFDPQMNIENDQTFSKKGSIWRERDVKIDKFAQLKNVIIGSGSVIGDVILTNTIVGRNCSVQSGVVVEDSILWDRVSLTAGSKIRESIVTNDNELSTQLGTRTVLPPKTQVSISPDNPAFTVYGHTPVETEDSDDEPDQIPIGNLFSGDLTSASLNLTDSEISEIGSDSDSDDDTSTHRRRHSSASGLSDNLNNEEFYTEAEESLSRAFLENHSVENATIELKTLRMATNVTFHEVREAIISALMGIVVTTPAKVGIMFAKWGELLENFTEDDEARLDIAFICQKYFLNRQEVERKGFMIGLQGLYQVDVLEEDAILKWFEDERSKGVGKWGEEMFVLRNSAEKFVTWLKEAEEESDE